MQLSSSCLCLVNISALLWSWSGRGAELRGAAGWSDAGSHLGHTQENRAHQREGGSASDHTEHTHTHTHSDSKNTGKTSSHYVVKASPELCSRRTELVKDLVCLVEDSPSATLLSYRGSFISSQHCPVFSIKEAGPMFGSWWCCDDLSCCISPQSHTHTHRQRRYMSELGQQWRWDYAGKWTASTGKRKPTARKTIGPGR